MPQTTGWKFHCIIVSILEYHGSAGPLSVVDSYRSPTLTNSFLGAARELGFKVTDVNGAQQQGKKSVRVLS